MESHKKTLPINVQKKSENKWNFKGTEIFKNEWNVVSVKGFSLWKNLETEGKSNMTFERRVEASLMKKYHHHGRLRLLESVLFLKLRNLFCFLMLLHKL